MAHSEKLLILHESNTSYLPENIQLKGRYHGMGDVIISGSIPLNMLETDPMIGQRYILNVLLLVRLFYGGVGDKLVSMSSNRHG
ncbi:hypothetical protein TNCT_644241 [Trichonephila clavata]|uniref:Uncharacterized protein n=1 Tax=Trichonephila clavata TaxID=2740835 RepID=A0A8X6I619_TRICU|nr:hypothetical protein TNCT_644241 [Trichonephila clavata]